MRTRRRLQRRRASVPGRYLYFVHLPPMWAKEHYPGDVELIFEGDSIIIRPLGAEGEK